MGKQQGKINFIFLWRQCDWGLFKRRNEALLLELAQRDSVASVLHIEPLTPKAFVGLIVRWWQAKDKSVRQVYRLHFKKAFSFIPVLVDVEKNIYVSSIFVLYSWDIAILKKLSNFLIRLQGNIINKIFIRSKTNIVLVVYPPSIYQPETINTIKHDVLIADLVDDVIARTTNTMLKDKYIDVCKRVLPKCKWIFATSPALEEYRGYGGREIEYLPNGVDPDEFSVSSSRKYFENRTRKIAGYVGNINQLVDLNLLEYILSCCPQVDFVLIGRTDRDRTRPIKKITERYSNCMYLGERKFTEIPGYLSSFDVLISFKKDDSSTRGNESMKIYQYLLSGKPVVSLPLSPADRFTDLIYVASDKLQFVKCLKQALVENDPEIRNKRIAVALENTWAKRADVILGRVSNYFGISTSNIK
ncbi:MAG: hypothetical protein HYV59_08670 [Planctomycetes bacterium]|nr:hypothetical protein [Planctomycetota bacterium]